MSSLNQPANRLAPAASVATTAKPMSSGPMTTPTPTKQVNPLCPTAPTSSTSTIAPSPIRGTVTIPNKAALTNALSNTMSLTKAPADKSKERLVGEAQERVVSRKRDIREYDLKKLDGAVTRETLEDGTVIERRTKVLWDQSHKITKDQLTKEHKIAAVDVEEREIVQSKVVTHEEIIEKKTIVPEKRRIEIPINHQNKK